MTKSEQNILGSVVLVASAWAAYFIFGEWLDGFAVFEHTVGLTAGVVITAFNAATY